MLDENLLRSEEAAVFRLRDLYRRHGYLPYRMSKFEEYDLYVRNKDFLVSDRVITFNDTNGKLLALKPDVTLSIIRSGEDVPGVKQSLIDYGFRLPCAYDNRPLKFEEWDRMRPQSIFVSATPGDWELEQSKGVFAEQVIRPTGLTDPMCLVRPVENYSNNVGGGSPGARPVKYRE